jgi:hypothetical protein
VRRVGQVSAGATVQQQRDDQSRVRLFIP